LLEDFELCGGVDQLLINFGSAQSLFTIYRSLQLLVFLNSLIGQLALLLNLCS